MRLLSMHYGIPFWVALPVCALFASIAGCFIGYPTLRMRGDYLAIVTLGFGEIIRIVLNNWMSLTNGPNGILGIASPTHVSCRASGRHVVRTDLPAQAPVPLLHRPVPGVFTIVAVHRLNFSRIGRAWEAIREDETAAELMGVNTFRLKLLAYAMGAVFGGLAGCLFRGAHALCQPRELHLHRVGHGPCHGRPGRLGSIPGIILGALALVALPEVFRGFELYRMLAFGGAMT
jgi:branched-chain amino acid transport system permease protein